MTPRTRGASRRLPRPPDGGLVGDPDGAVDAAGERGPVASQPGLHRADGRVQGRSEGRRDRGQVSVLVAGLLGVVLLLVLGGVDVTAAQIARARLFDASDAAALEAASALDEAVAYSSGVGSSVVVSSATVRRAVEDNLAARPLPRGISSWAPGAGTGTPDGRTAAVVLQGVADLPITGGLLGALGRSVTITVESRARAPLR